MNNRLCAIALAAAFVLSPSFAQAPAQPPSLPPVEAFASLPSLSNPSLSSDGKYLALIQAYKGRPVATVWTLEPSGSPPVMIPQEEGVIDDVRWANDHRLLIRVNLNARVWGHDVIPFHRTLALDPDAGNAVILLSNMQGSHYVNSSASDIIDIAPNDPDHIYMPLFAGGGYVGGMYEGPRITLFRVDINSGKAKPVEGGGPHTATWFMDGSGNIVAREDQTNDPLTDHIIAYTAGSGQREIASADATGGRGIGIVGLSLDGSSLVQTGVYSETRGTDGLALRSLSDGKLTELSSDPIYDVAGAIVDPWTSRVVGAAYVSHLIKSVYFDSKLKELQEKLEANFPGLSVQALAWDLAVNKVVICVDGPATPPTYYLFNRSSNALTKLGRTHSGLQVSDLGRINVYDYKARDGLNIPAYLTLPPGRTPTNLPVVILPHGGPTARDNMSFNWESQFLANRGYAVLQPNFRGSSGYGRKFEEAGYGQWGLKMQDDITDGVMKLIADGIADPKRICIVGGSYGGYAALAGAAFTPNLYACAAAWAPVSDLRELLYTKATDYGSNSWVMSTVTRYIGDRRSDAKKLDAASPAQHADKIIAPILLMHGEADATVRIDQSEIMAKALRTAGKKVAFIRIPDETHNMQTAASRIRWLTELEKFLKENIGN